MFPKFVNIVNMFLGVFFCFEFFMTIHARKFLKMFRFTRFCCRIQYMIVFRMCVLCTYVVQKGFLPDVYFVTKATSVSLFAVVPCQ